MKYFFKVELNILPLYGTPTRYMTEIGNEIILLQHCMHKSVFTFSLVSCFPPCPQNIKEETEVLRTSLETFNFQESLALEAWLSFFL